MYTHAHDHITPVVLTGSGGSHGQLIRPYLGSSGWPGSMPCWWVLMRMKQLSLAVTTTGVIWLCACLRYWPYRGVGTCVSVLKLVLLKQLSRYLSPWQAPFPAPPTQTIVGSCTLSPAFFLQVLLSTTGTLACWRWVGGFAEPQKLKRSVPQPKLNNSII